MSADAGRWSSLGRRALDDVRHPIKIVRRVRSMPLRPWGPAAQLDVHDILLDLLWAYLDLQEENRRLRREAGER